MVREQHACRTTLYMIMLQIENERYPWINRELIENLLKLRGDESAGQLIDYRLHDAVGKGENYTSHLIRVSANVGTKEVSFVIKTTLSKDIHEMLEKISLFAKEITFYRDMLPKFEPFTRLMDVNFKCSPRCLKLNDDPLYFVFEDLRETGYRNMDRHIGLDFEATKMLLLKLAKFHAAGCMIYEQNPELFTHHRKNIVNMESTEIMQGFTSGMRDIQDACLYWPGYEHYSVKLQNLLEVILEKVAGTFEYDPHAFNTLTHGDLWVNNIMYKFDDTNTPIDVLMVDYQIGCYGSPAIDLSYLMYTSTTNYMFEQDWDRLIQIYHAELVKSLEVVNYKKAIPTLNEIQMAFLQRSMYSVMVSLAVIAPRHIINTEMADVESYLKNAEEHKRMRAELYQMPKVVERIKYMLDYFDRKGFLEV